MQKSASLEYGPSSEPLHNSAQWLADKVVQAGGAKTTLSADLTLQARRDSTRIRNKYQRFEDFHRPSSGWWGA
jgi:hypothetical protein